MLRVIVPLFVEYVVVSVASFTHPFYNGTKKELPSHSVTPLTVRYTSSNILHKYMLYFSHLQGFALVPTHEMSSSCTSNWRHLVYSLSIGCRRHKAGSSLPIHLHTKLLTIATFTAKLFNCFTTRETFY